MAQVFLSYDRDDAAKARAIAQALDRAGHSVWWDLHIRGGSQYAKVIDEALKAAETVVVLWSAQSIESAWVRDEAAAGRDSGRLVPVSLDRAEPPLGFRQFQTIDFSQWKGRGRPALLRTLLADIEAVAAASQPRGAPVKPSPPAGANTFVLTSPRRRLLAAAGLLILLFGGAAYWMQAGRGSGAPDVAVRAADTSALSQDMARKVLVNMGSLPGAVEAGYHLLDGQSSKHADLQVSVSASQNQGQVQATVALKSPSDDTILWSKQFEQRAAPGTKLEEPIAFAIARVIGCAIESSTPNGGPRADRRRLYVNACAAFAELGYDKRSIIPTLRNITDAAPGFMPAWARLLIAESQLVSLLPPWDAGFKTTQYDIRRDIATVRKLEPNLPEAVVAEAELERDEPYLRRIELIDKATAAHPNNAAVIAAHSSLMLDVGRMFDGLGDARRAAELDPLSPDRRAAWIAATAAAGNIGQAREQLIATKQIWPNAPVIQSVGFALDLRYGDFEKTFRSSGHPIDGGLIAYFKANREPTEGNIDAFVTMAQTHKLISGQRMFVLEALPEMDRVNELYNLVERWPLEQDLHGSARVLFLPHMAKFRRDPRFMRVAQRLGLLSYWQSSGVWPDFCLDAGLPYDCKAVAAKLG